MRGRMIVLGNIKVGKVGGEGEIGFSWRVSCWGGRGNWGRLLWIRVVMVKSNVLLGMLGRRGRNWRCWVKMDLIFPEQSSILYYNFHIIL